MTILQPSSREFEVILAYITARLQQQQQPILLPLSGVYNREISQLYFKWTTFSASMMSHF